MDELLYTTKLPNWLQPGKQIAIKATAELRKYGLQCRNQYGDADNRLWPGEIGDVVEHTAGFGDNRYRMLFAVWDRGRTLALGTMVHDDMPGMTGEWRTADDERIRALKGVSKSIAKKASTTDE